jgi:hypothetical protein
MSLKRSSPPAPSAELVNAVMDGYVAWREQTVALDAAYANWTRAAASEREPAFETYRTALDREEEAAAAYQRIVEHLGALYR